MNIYNFATDTATLCIFDLECLKHRLNDDVDWWSIQDDSLSEINKGNVAFIELPEDGEYSFMVVDKIVNSQFTINLDVPSGYVFIGAGEEVTADELEPECVRGGTFIELNQGKYILKSKIENEVILLSFEATENSLNAFKDSINLEWS